MRKQDGGTRAAAGVRALKLSQEMMEGFQFTCLGKGRIGCGGAPVLQRPRRLAVSTELTVGGLGTGGGQEGCRKMAEGLREEDFGVDGGVGGEVSVGGRLGSG